MDRCEFVKQDQDGRVTIWIDIDQPFFDSNFFEVIQAHGALEVLEKQCVFLSVGPAEIIEEINTNKGKFSLSKQFEDMCAGIDIYSDDRTLMLQIADALAHSPLFRERQLGKC
jgi:hypothetical protein